MWSDNEGRDPEFPSATPLLSESAVEAIVRDAVWMPQPTERFRKQVLSAATTVVRQTQRRHWWQQTLSTGLAASLLFVLPNLIWHGAHPVGTGSTPTSPPAFSAAATPAGVRVADDYEWSLVQAALSTRSESSRMLRGAL